MRYREITETKSGTTIAYHGSPHKFDSFKFGAGKGTGNSGYGHGMYFTPSKEVAERYRSETAGDKGYLYTVELPPLSRFLNWDLPFKQQSAYVKKALRNLPPLTDSPDACNRYIKSCIDDNDDGRLFFFSMNNFARNELRIAGEREYVTDLFVKAGIVGMIYDNDDDDVNYVVFDQKTIRILSRNEQGEVTEGHLEGGYQWVKPYNNQDVVVMVDVQKLDASFAQDTDFYVGQNGSRGIINRYDKFGEWVKQGIPVKMPEISLNPHGEISFTNGRHRYAWMRDQGATTLPMAVEPDQAEEIKRRFGA